MAVVNPMMTPMFNPNVKDSRWLTLEVCREFQRTKCSRTENECKFAHPPAHVEVQNGRVTCCFDSIKGKCQRKEPPCKYLHPPQHLREQLLQNGRNNLIIKNLQMQYIAAGIQPTMIPGLFPAQTDQTQGQNTASEYRASPNPTYYTYEQVPPYIVPQNAAAAAAAFGGQYGLQAVGTAAGTIPTMLSTVDTTGAATGAAAGATGASATPTSQVLTATKITRPDRLENNMGGLQNMVPVMKRPALDTKSGVPMYQPTATAAAAYQQAALAAMQLQQQPFVPVSTALRGQPTVYGTYSPYIDNVAGQPPGMQRF